MNIFDTQVTSKNEADYQINKEVRWRFVSCFHFGKDVWKKDAQLYGAADQATGQGYSTPFIAFIHHRFNKRISMQIFF